MLNTVDECESSENASYEGEDEGNPPLIWKRKRFYDVGVCGMPSFSKRVANTSSRLITGSSMK